MWYKAYAKEFDIKKSTSGGKKSFIRCCTQFSKIYSYHPLTLWDHTPTHSESGPRKYPGNTKEECVALGGKRILESKMASKIALFRGSPQTEVERIKR